MLHEALNAARVRPEEEAGELNLVVGNDTCELVNPSDFGITSLCITAHPEGADRGGYVPTAFSSNGNAIWDEGGGEWQSR
jgi:hypothetical protein